MRSEGCGGEWVPEVGVGQERGDLCKVLGVSVCV